MQRQRIAGLGAVHLCRQPCICLADNVCHQLTTWILPCTGKWVVLAHLVQMNARLVQNWDFHKVDPKEKVVWPRCEAHAENGLMLRRGAAPEAPEAPQRQGPLNLF